MNRTRLQNKIVGGAAHNLALTDQGEIIAWGNDSSKQCRDAPKEIGRAHV